MRSTRRTSAIGKPASAPAQSSTGLPCSRPSDGARAMAKPVVAGADLLDHRHRLRAPAGCAKVAARDTLLSGYSARLYHDRKKAVLVYNKEQISFARTGDSSGQQRGQRKPQENFMLRLCPRFDRPERLCLRKFERGMVRARASPERGPHVFRRRRTGRVAEPRRAACPRRMS